MKFRLLGQDVAISEAAESYNTYRKLFIGQAKTAANQFFDTYERNQSLEDVVRKTPDQIAACIAPPVELCIQILVDHGVYTIDREQFSSTYRSYLDRWKKAYEAICDQYDSIVSEQEELDQYRVARRENRGRWRRLRRRRCIERSCDRRGYEHGIRRCTQGRKRRRKDFLIIICFKRNAEDLQ